MSRHICAIPFSGLNTKLAGDILTLWAMRRWFYLLFLSIITLQLPAQNVQQQEQRVFLNYKFERTSNSLEARYEEVIRKEDSGWHVWRYFYPDKQLAADYYIIEPTSRFKHGLALSYYANGQIADSGSFTEGYKEKWHWNWYENGKPKTKFKYRNGLPVDTCTSWYATGETESVWILDTKGSGYRRDMYPSQQLKAVGPISKGLQFGRWRYFDEAGPQIMEARFDGKGPQNITCFDTAGKKTNGPCILEKGPEYIGGTDAWNRFLSTEAVWPAGLRLPDKIVQVAVSFVVYTDGHIGDFHVLHSPHPLLTKEALRLLQLSGKWHPAVFMNKPVDFRYTSELYIRQKYH